MATRDIIITGNWKMYKTVQEAIDYVQELAPLIRDVKTKVYLAIPFTTIQSVAKAAQNLPITIGAQNMNDVSEGAFTGEISVKMLKDVGAKFVLLGHSERRHIFGEDNAFINRKVKRALAEGIQPILCIGETLKEKEEGKTEEVLQKQILESLADVKELQSLVLAYEPVWAIGTGETATSEQAQEAHKFCRKVVAKEWGKEVAAALIIQYGGSVKPDNAKALLEQPDIDGLLVGGASLTPQIFSEIIKAESKVTL